MPIPLKFLLLEDDALDAELVVATLQAEGYACQWQRVQTQSSFSAALDDPDYDIILADYNLPSFDGLAALKIFIKRKLDIPFIIVSGNLGEEIAIESLKSGATDFVLKDRLSRLAPSIKRALAEHELRRLEKQKSADLALTNALNHAANRGASMKSLVEILDTKIQESFDCIGTAVYMLSEDNKFLELQNQVLPPALTQKIEKLIGVPIPALRVHYGSTQQYKEMLAKGIFKTKDPLEIQDAILDLVDASALPEKIKPVIRRLIPQIHKLSQVKSFITIPFITQEESSLGMLSLTFARDYHDEDVQRMSVIAEQVTTILSRKQSEVELARLAAVVNQASVSVVITNTEGKIIYLNPFSEQSSGYRAAELIGENARILKSGEHDAVFYDKLWAAISSGDTWSQQIINKRKDGSLYHEDMLVFPIKSADGKIINYAAVKREISAEVHANEQIRRQLAQLEALHTIDEAISASMDLNLTINVILRQIRQQLDVHATDILIFNPMLQTLKCEAREGFRTQALEHTHLRLGHGLAGRAAMQSKIVHIADITTDKDAFKGAPDLVKEGFVTYWGVPLIAKGQLKGVLEIFHRTALEPNEEWQNFLTTLASQAAIAVDNATLFDNLQKSNMELRLAYDTTLEGWAHALEMRDMETEGHSRRVTELALQLAQTLGMDEQALVHMRRGALLHDIGKMGIPDSILHKPGPLNDDEWAIMRQHPVFAYNLLSPIPYLQPALDIPYYHHEKWDGSGYPLGLSGEAIPLAARIFAVVDVWDALLSDRPYREAWPREKVFAHIQEQAGTYFDPRVVEAFIALTSSEDEAAP